MVNWLNRIIAAGEKIKSVLRERATAKDMAKAAKDAGMEGMLGGALGGQAQ